MMLIAIIERGKCFFFIRARIGKNELVQKKFIEFLIENKALKFGEFTLK